MAAGNCKDNTINYYFIGNKDDLKNETIFKYFDTNYIPLNNILLSYYQTMGSKTEDKDFNISNYSEASRNKLIGEINKCACLCANQEKSLLPTDARWESPLWQRR